MVSLERNAREINVLAQSVGLWDWLDANPIGEQWYVVFKWKYDIRPRNRPTKCRDEILQKCQPNDIFMEYKTRLPVYFFLRRTIIKNYTDWVKIKIRFNPLKLKLKYILR